MKLLLPQFVQSKGKRIAAQVLKFCLKSGGPTWQSKVSWLSSRTFVSLTIVCFIVININSASFLSSAFGVIFIGILTNLWAASAVSFIGFLLWFAGSNYKEKEFTVHLFNYKSNGNIGRKRERLAGEIRKGVESEIKEVYFSLKLVAATDETKMRGELANEIASCNNGHIAIVPFMEMAKTIGEIFGSPSCVPSHNWREQSEVEVTRTFAMLVTYDPQLETRLTCVRNLRVFSTPLIDVAAMFNDMIDNPGATDIVLLGEKDGEFLEVERALCDFVNRKIARLLRLQGLTGKIVQRVVEVDQHYSPKNGQKICFFVMTVDPSELILIRLQKLIALAKRNNAEILDIYVPPTWLRNWTVNEGTKQLISYWNDWLYGRKLTTALPEGIVTRSDLWQDDGPCFDIILYYTRLAVDLAKNVRSGMLRKGGAIYSKTAETLDEEVQSVLREWSSRDDNCFLGAFERGDLFYEPVIVKFSPEMNKKKNFRLDLGRRTK